MKSDESSENGGIFAAGLAGHCLPLALSRHVKHLEPLMLKSLLKSDSFLWVVLDEQGDQVLGLCGDCHLVTPLV